MRIGIDCRLWNETGVGRYLRNLVTNLSKIDKKNEYVLFARNEDEKTIRSVLSRPKADQPLAEVVRTDIPWHGLSEQVRLPRILNDANLDLVHFPYFSVPFFYNKPFIVTVHDLIINRFATGRASTLPYPLYFVKRLGYHAVLANAVLRAKKIIVPSNTVRSDLIETYLKIDLSKVEVTYEGGFDHSEKRKAKSDKPMVDDKYFLRVGNFYPHKNVEGLLAAFASFVYENSSSDVKLVLVGKRDYFFRRIEREVDKLGVSANVVFLDNVSDSELINLYKYAIATVVPSFAEGFSLTAVESMSMGTPVIASDIPVHREICSNAAIYCNPNEVNDIKQKLQFACSLVEDSRKELIEQGKKQAKKFSWQKMATQTLKIYNSI